MNTHYLRCTKYSKKKLHIFVLCVLSPKVLDSSFCTSKYDHICVSLTKLVNTESCTEDTVLVMMYTHTERKRET